MKDNLAARLLHDHEDFVDAEPLVDVPGMSSPRVCNLLNLLVRNMDRGECYLEVGTWQGLTLLSAAYGNFGRTCIGCDKFRLYGRFTGLGLLAKRSLYRNIRRYRGHTADVHFHHAPFQRVFQQRRISSPVGVYFYDGDHSFGGTYTGVVEAAPFLNERAVLLMDDWNDPVIRQATWASLERAHLRVLWFRALRGNQTAEQWWNGLGVFFLQKETHAPRLVRDGAARHRREKRPRRAHAARAWHAEPLSSMHRCGEARL